MLGTQFHPELRSRPNRPHPLFREFVRAAVGMSKGASPIPEVTAAATAV